MKVQDDTSYGSSVPSFLFGRATACAPAPQHNAGWVLRQLPPATGKSGWLKPTSQAQSAEASDETQTSETRHPFCTLVPQLGFFVP